MKTKTADHLLLFVVLGQDNNHRVLPKILMNFLRIQLNFSK